jgi:hypothetical protein
VPHFSPFLREVGKWLQKFSREAAQERSPPRERWVMKPKKQSPVGATERENIPGQQPWVLRKNFEKKFG